MSEGGLIPPVILEIKARAGELLTELGHVKSEVKSMADDTEAQSGRMSKGFQAAAGAGKAITVGLAGAAVTVGGFAIEAATAAQVVDAKLSTAIKNAGGNMEELEPKIGATDAKLRTFGFTNDQTNTALATLTTALKDPEKAMGAMSVAADLAKAKNIDLNSASLLVAKAMEGQTRPLKQLGIDLPVAAGGAEQVKTAQEGLATAQEKVNDILAKTPGAANASSKAHEAYEKAVRGVDDAQKKLKETQDTGNQILSAVESRVKGAAGAYGDTLKGKVDSAKASLENMAESLGKKLIPIIDNALKAAQKFIGWLSDHKGVLDTIVTIIGTTMVAAIGAYITKLALAAKDTVVGLAKMAAGFFGLRDAEVASGEASETALGPIGLAIGLIVLAIYELVTHWKTVWGWIKDAVSVVWDFLKTAFEWIGHVFFDGIKIYLDVLKTFWGGVWDVVKAVFKGVWDFLKGAWDWISSTFMSGLKNDIGAVKNVWSTAWNGIKSAVSTVWDWLKGAWDWISNRFMNGLKTDIGAVKTAWSDVWGGIKKVVSDVWDFIKGIFDKITGAVKTVSGAIGGVAKTVGGAFSGVAHFLGFDDGGVVPGPKGAPRLAVVHGGEYVLSNEMLAGRQAPTGLTDAQSANGYAAASSSSMSQAALTGGTSPASVVGAGGPGGTVINNYVRTQTNADPHRIASEIGWKLAQMAS